MRRRPLILLLVSLMMLSATFTGCRRNSAAPPLEELTAEEEAAAAMEEAQANTEGAGTGESPVATPVPTVEASPTPVPTVAAEPTPVPTATTAPVEQETEAPTAEPTESATETEMTEGTTHVVQAGENLFRISLRYGLTTAEMAAANNITNPALIYVGQTLAVPAGAQAPTAPPATGSCSATYVVQPGDNLFRIALRYNYSQFYLAQYNGITNPSVVYVGQQICIP